MSESVVLILPCRLRIEARECKYDTVSGRRWSAIVHGGALMMDDDFGARKQSGEQEYSQCIEQIRVE